VTAMYCSCTKAGGSAARTTRLVEDLSDIATDVNSPTICSRALKDEDCVVLHTSVVG